MAKSLRSKRKQKVKRLRREKYRLVERKKCWDKHLAIQAGKSETMILEDAEMAPGGSVTAEPTENPQSPQEPTAVAMETNTAPKMSRKQVLKKMKIREARRRGRKTKRLGGKRSHSKW